MFKPKDRIQPQAGREETALIFSSTLPEDAPSAHDRESRAAQGLSAGLAAENTGSDPAWQSYRKPHSLPPLSSLIRQMPVSTLGP